MFKKMPNASNLLYTMLVAVFLVGCKKGARYTDNECLNFKKGDTIYVSYTGDIQKAIVLKNDTIKKIIELKRMPIFKEIKSYEDVRFE